MRLSRDNDFYKTIVKGKQARSVFKNEHPEWKSDPNKTIFMDYLEPFTDPTLTLREAIEAILVSDDIVLCTPLQADYFSENSSQEVHIFDISLGQLVNIRIRDAFKGYKRDYWWIDLFDERMLKEVLAKSRISFLYASNIIEWASDQQQLEIVAKVIVDSGVKRIMFSIINTINSRNSQFFIQLMKSKGWEKKIFSNKKGESIVVLTRA